MDMLLEIMYDKYIKSIFSQKDIDTEWYLSFINDEAALIALVLLREGVY